MAFLQECGVNLTVPQGERACKKKQARKAAAVLAAATVGNDGSTGKSSVKLPEGTRCSKGTCDFAHDTLKPGEPCFRDPRWVGRCPTSCCSASSGGQSTCGPSASAPLFDIPAGRHRISLSLHSYNAFQNELGTIRKVLSSPTIAKSRTPALGSSHRNSLPRLFFSSAFAHAGAVDR